MSTKSVYIVSSKSTLLLFVILSLMVFFLINTLIVNYKHSIKFLPNSFHKCSMHVLSLSEASSLVIYISPACNSI